MSPGTLKAICIACLLVVVGALYLAVDQYRTNAANVAVMNENPMMLELNGGRKLEPATPTATKYAVVLAVLAGAGGAVSLYSASSKGKGSAR